MSRAILTATPDVTRFDVMLQSTEGLVFHSALTLPEIKALLQEGSAILLCPTEWVSFVDIDLPNVKANLLKVVVPNLVEEQLAEPIEHIQCALPSVRVGGGKTPVAIIRRDHVEEVVKAFQEANIHLEAMSPDIYALPVVEQGWSSWENKDQLLVRQDQYHGFALHASEINTWFADMQKPEQIVQQTDDAVHAGMRQLFETSLPINLLQDDFAPKVKKKNMNLLKTSLLALGGSILFYFMYLIGMGAVLSSRLTHLQSQTLALYQQVFPGATQATSPRVLLSRELQKQGQSQQRFFVLMSALTTGLSRDKSIELMHVQFTGDRVTATVTAKDFAALESLPTFFDASTVIFKQENAEQKEDHVEARIQLEAKS